MPLIIQDCNQIMHHKGNARFLLPLGVYDKMQIWGQSPVLKWVKKALHIQSLQGELQF